MRRKLIAFFALFVLTGFAIASSSVLFHYSPKEPDATHQERVVVQPKNNRNPPVVRYLSAQTYLTYSLLEGIWKIGFAATFILFFVVFFHREEETE